VFVRGQVIATRSNLQNSQFFSLIDGNLPRGDRFDPHCIHSHAVRSP
jgi:hypothetical protein